MAISLGLSEFTMILKYVLILEPGSVLLIEETSSTFKRWSNSLETAEIFSLIIQMIRRVADDEKASMEH